MVMRQVVKVGAPWLDSLDGERVREKGGYGEWGGAGDD